MTINADTTTPGYDLVPVNPDFRIDRLFQAVEWAIADYKKSEGKWNQSSWGEVMIDLNADVDQMSKVKSGDAVVIDCGTSFCLAGHLCAAEGDKFVLEKDYLLEEIDFWSAMDSPLTGESVRMGVEDVLTVDGKVERIRDRAWDLLGLDSTDRFGDEHPHVGPFGLFSGENSIDDVIRIATRLARMNGYVVTFSNPYGDGTFEVAGA